MKILEVILTCFMLVNIMGCSEIKSDNTVELEPIEKYLLQITEPSGLAFSNGSLWTVSDENSTVYKVNADGKIVYSFEVNGNNLEGITVVDDTLIAVVLEQLREVVLIDTLGNEISRYSINLSGEKNSGLEGISYNPANQHFYIVNEKDPVLLMETDRNFIELTRKNIKEANDLSGIYYSSKEDCLWLLSDEDSKIIKYSFENKILAEYKLNVEQPEGITLNEDESRIYIVSDKTGELFVYSNPD